MFNIVLVYPEIPQNTGNIARTCSVTGARLHLVKPLGFDIDNASLKRAGLDYWDELDITVYENLEEFFEKNKGNYYFLSKKGAKSYANIEYKDGDYLIFGRESVGLDEDLLRANYDNTLRVPMREKSRSLNLSNTVAIVLYEALRQTGFKDLTTKGPFNL
ncbi:MAG: tRNA (uridine(34)/cytosine(34)/5-carboxymethylaminomethyluridine(34)-2'-O)-methyltransferase TrmL [Clostridia bacterium]|nr:tRNA (uridine(34)/cytosine(34)/5-carboxymethylaminomethyluridine(34)-2'-O)-methyltransferase TrmL [Clostridia bacterium]